MLAGSVIGSASTQAAGIRVVGLSGQISAFSGVSAELLRTVPISASIDVAASVEALGYKATQINGAITGLSATTTAFVLVNDHIAAPAHRKIRPLAEGRTIAVSGLRTIKASAQSRTITATSNNLIMRVTEDRTMQIELKRAA